MQCATHPDTETELGCSRCGKAICPRCLIHGPVGARCRECANVRRIPTYNLSTSTYVRAIGAAVATGIVLGILWAIFNPLTGFFFGTIAGLALGSVAGQMVSFATNRKAGPPLQVIAAGSVVLAYLVRTSTLLLFSSAWTFTDVRFDLSGLIALALGCFIAAGRMR